MANNYINVIKTLTGTSATGVYTVPDDKVAIVKTLSAYNTATGAATVLTVQLTDTSATSTISFDKASVAAVTRKAFLQNGEVLVLDEKDVIKLTASVANKFHVYIGILDTDYETTL